MSSSSEPWWKKVNDYLAFEERDEFVRGALGFRPNLKFDILMSNLSSGYVRNKFDRPQPTPGRNEKVS